MNIVQSQNQFHPSFYNEFIYNSPSNYQYSNSQNFTYEQNTTPYIFNEYKSTSFNNIQSPNLNIYKSNNVINTNDIFLNQTPLYNQTYTTNDTFTNNYQDYYKSYNPNAYLTPNTKKYGNGIIQTDIPRTKNKFIYTYTQNLSNDLLNQEKSIHFNDIIVQYNNFRNDTKNEEQINNIEDNINKENNNIEKNNIKNNKENNNKDESKVNSHLSNSNIIQNNESINNVRRSNQSKEEEKKIESPQLNAPPSPKDQKPSFCNRNAKEEFDEIFKKSHKILSSLTPDEELLLKKEKAKSEKEFDFKSHFEVTLIKQITGFNYKKVHKVAIPLLAHYEMPQNYEYKSPLLSPDGRYLSCIARGIDDIVYIWDVNDLYWYKYKFSDTQIDGVAFTPDSKSVIIIYKKSNPVIYSLKTGKKILDMWKNGEEGNREGLQYKFSVKVLTKNTFAYASRKSLTVWSLNDKPYEKLILDDSPMKIISNDNIILIGEDLGCRIKRICDEAPLGSFEIKGVDTYHEILDAKCNKDVSKFLYVIKQGIIQYKFFEKEYKNIQNFISGVEHATLSDDCRYVLKTNMHNLTVYDLEKEETVCTLLKNSFKEYKIDFINKRIVFIDDISIYIKKYDESNSPEKYVWLNENPNQLQDVRFNNDHSVMFARVDQSNAIAYDLNSGYVLKKWHFSEGGDIKYDMTNFGGDRIAIKLNPLLVQIWNYKTQEEDASFYGYNCHNLHFSSSGKYLACGGSEGPEVARIWGIDNKKYGIFRFLDENENINTIAHLTSPEPKRLICCSIHQKPLIYDSDTKEILHKCECDYNFEEIYEIQSDLRFNVFIIKGRDEQNRKIGVMYKISDGIMVRFFENYTFLELAKHTGFVVFKCDNINNGNLSSMNIKNLDNIELNIFKVQDDKCQLLNDNKSALIQKGDDLNCEYIFINIENGEYIGKIIFEKRNDSNSFNFINDDLWKNELYFRYFEFLSPQETMLYKKKNIFTVEED